MLSAFELTKEVKVYKCLNPHCTVILYRALNMPPFSNCPNCVVLGIVAEDSYQES